MKKKKFFPCVYIVNISLTIYIVFVFSGMYPQWYVVCGWEEGVAYGSQQILWRRKCIYDSTGGGKSFLYYNSINAAATAALDLIITQEKFLFCKKKKNL